MPKIGSKRGGARSVHRFDNEAAVLGRFEGIIPYRYREHCLAA